MAVPYFDTVAEIKAFERERGGFFFEPETMRFFASKVEAGVYGGRFFITSEQFKPSSGAAYNRMYTVREVTADGFSTPGMFQEFDTLAEARDAARLLVADDE